MASRTQSNTEPCDAVSICHKGAQRRPPEVASLTSINFNQHQQPRLSSRTNIAPMFLPCAGKKDNKLFSAVVQLGVPNDQPPPISSRSTDPRCTDPALKALQLTEGLKPLLEGWGSDREQESVRKQVATDTADVILRRLERDEVSTAGNGSVRKRRGPQLPVSLGFKSAAIWQWIFIVVIDIWRNFPSFEMSGPANCTRNQIQSFCSQQAAPLVSLHPFFLLPFLSFNPSSHLHLTRPFFCSNSATLIKLLNPNFLSSLQ